MREGKKEEANETRDVQRRGVLRITSHLRVDSYITEAALCMNVCVCVGVSE